MKERFRFKMLWFVKLNKVEQGAEMEHSVLQKHAHTLEKKLHIVVLSKTNSMTILNSSIS